MPAKLEWSDYRDQQLRRLRHGRHSWAAISAHLGVSVNAAMERARTIGALLPIRPTVTELLEELDRPPLSKGHAISWGAIIAGTLLDGEPYPRQPPMGRIPTGIIGELC